MAIQRSTANKNTNKYDAYPEVNPKNTSISYKIHDLIFWYAITDVAIHNGIPIIPKNKSVNAVHIYNE